MKHHIINLKRSGSDLSEIVINPSQYSDRVFKVGNHSNSKGAGDLSKRYQNTSF